MKTMKMKKNEIEKECLIEENKLAKLIEQADAMEAANAAEDENIQKMEEELDELETKLTELTASLAGTEKSTEESRHAKNQLEANASKDLSKKGRMASELEVCQARSAEIAAQLEAIVAECLIHEEHLDECDERYEEHEEKVKGLETESTSICNIVKSQLNAEADTVRKLGEGGTVIDVLSLKYKDTETEALGHEERNAELEAELEKIEEELAAIKEKHAETVLHVQSCVNEINDM